jgi:lysozyme
VKTRGIDVSHWQGTVDWPQVAESDAKFAIAKATEATSIDEQFKRNWQGIQDVGLYRGAYHFARPGTDPETQASFFASVVGPLGFRDLPPVLDLEQADAHDAAYVLDWAQRFVRKAEALFGRRLIVYTGQFWRGALGDPAPDDLFSQRPLWLAGYVPEASLKLPKTWSRWTFWQYADGTGSAAVKIPGLARCDQNWFDGDEAALDALCRPDAPPPPQPSAAANGAWPGVEFIWPRTPAVAGDAVKAWQMRMVALGFQVDLDGVYGPQSKAACAAFQRNHGLVADGVVGRATWNTIFAPAG